MKITIETATNGWLVRKEPDELDNRSELYVYGYSEHGSETQEVETFASVLWSITELVGPTTSRYSKARIYVEVKPGDKCMDHVEED